jgi:hypothetical protein
LKRVQKDVWKKVKAKNFGKSAKKEKTQNSHSFLGAFFKNQTTEFKSA